MPGVGGESIPNAPWPPNRPGHHDPFDGDPAIDTVPDQLIRGADAIGRRKENSISGVAPSPASVAREPEAALAGATGSHALVQNELHPANGSVAGEGALLAHIEPAPGGVVLPPLALMQVEGLDALSIEALATSDRVYNYELAWLDFNWRVLFEAMDARTPLLERLKFIAITASNLDEYFSKRVGGLKRQAAAGISNLKLEGMTPAEKLALIAQAIHPMIEQQSETLLNHILPELAEQGVMLLDYSACTPEQREYLDLYFVREVYPILTPLAVDPGHPFPFISNLSLSLGVHLRNPATGESFFSRLKVPANRPRWVPLNTPLHFVPLGQVIVANLDRLYPGMEVRAAYPFRVTRNADLDRNEEEAEDLLEMINEELRERRFAPVVRLEVDASMPDAMVEFLRDEMELDAQDVYRIRGPLRQTDFFALAELNLSHLKYDPWTPLVHPRFAVFDRNSRPADLFTAIRQGDILVHHPYQSFTASTQVFIEMAARDPQVLAIKQTLYRTSSDSPIVNALIQAAERGKQVAVLVEVKARFDEERNIEWARKLEDAGCHVAYGLVGLKTHTKLSLIVREEEDGLRSYFHVGTGNYNPKTATLYTDLGLISCDPDLGADIMDLFNYLTGYSRQNQYRKLLVAPVTMRKRFVKLIEQETANAMAGKSARIIAKMNTLDDTAIVKKLYEASQAGVQIDLIIRGTCRVRTGIPGISENIRVISVIGRFLEHSRIFYFENGGEPLYFIGSADWMRRNLSNRVEAITPIEDPRLQEQLHHILQTSLADYRQAWEMLPDSRYRQRRPPDDASSAFAEGTHVSLMEYTKLITKQSLVRSPR
jgi:polyphosphate kinase